MVPEANADKDNPLVVAGNQSCPAHTNKGVRMITDSEYKRKCLCVVLLNCFYCKCRI